MRYSITGILFFLNLFWTHAQNWGANTFSQSINEALDIEVNSLNQSYVTGYLSGQTSFSPSINSPNSNGNTDAYIAKYDATGNILWLKQFGGNFADKAVDIAIGSDQNIAITGHFFGTVTFGAFTLTSTNNTKDIFLLKLDPSGNVLWARKEGGNLSDESYKLTIDNQNNILLTGSFQGNATIGNSTFSSVIDPTTNQPSADLFIAKYTSSGTPIWALQGGALYDDRGMSVATDAADNVFFTGQFSDNLQFASNTYSNNGFNVGFVCKLNPSGQVQFLNLFKAGLVAPYDLEINSNNEAVIVGDFIGNMNYYDASGAHPIQNPYDKQLFLVKIASNGNFIWQNTLGSNNELSARSIAIDPANNIYTTGYFKCDLSQLQDTVNHLFSSVGYKDPYLIKWSDAGTRNYVKHFGSKLDDEGRGVAVNQTDTPIICGSYTQDLNFMPGVALLGSNSFSFNPFFGSEPYHYYLTGDQSRNSFLTNHVNANYPEYDYFKPPGTDSTEGYIWTNGTLGNTDLDTIHFCTNAQLQYETNSYSHTGPDYSLLWFDGSQASSIYVINTGYYWIQATRTDGCVAEIDSVFAIQEPIPNLPLLTDNLGINTNNPGPIYESYHLCYPDSVELLFTNLSPGSTVITYGNAVTFYGPGPHTLNQELQYFVTVTNAYCQRSGEFIFQLDYATPPDSIDLSIAMNTNSPSRDSIVVCENSAVQFHGIDLINNPNANFYPTVFPPLDSIAWFINGVQQVNYDTCASIFTPTYTGWYTVDLMVVRGYNNLCGIDTTWYHTTKQFYITVNPIPDWNTNISGTGQLCPNETTFLVADNPNSAFTWTGNNILWTNNADSIEINAPGWYSYGGMITDSVTGCFQGFNFTNYIDVKVPPTIYSDPEDAIICPFDSILLFVNDNYQSYVWIGPNGDTLSTTASCYTSQIGYYSCIVIDNDGCELISTPFEVFEYSTPTLFADPQGVICSNEYIDIQVNYSGSTSFIWLNDGSTADHFTTNIPGVYVVQMTQCGFTALDSIEIIDGSFNPIITVSDSTLCAGDTAHFEGNILNQIYTWNTGDLTDEHFETTQSGTYYATVTNNYGCSAQTNTINIVILPNTNPPTAADQTPCVGDDVTISESGNQLNWYTTDTSFLFTSSSVNLPSIQNDTAFVIAFPGANASCGSIYNLVNIDVQTPPTSVNIIGDSVLCTNENTTLTAVTNDQVVWTINGNPAGSQNPITILYSELNANNVFQIQLTNACYQVQFEDSVELISPASISLDEDTLTLCYFESGVFSLSTLNIDSIIWNGTTNSDDFMVFGNQQYSPITVYGFDVHGCQTLSTTAIVITSTYSLQTTLDLPDNCPGATGILSAQTTSDSIQWVTPIISLSENPFSFIVSASNSGYFYLNTWDDLGCAYHDSILVSVSPIPNLDILPDTIFCANDLYTIYFPDDGNTYTLTPFGTNTTFPVVPNQPVILNVTTTDGCVASDTLVIEMVNCSDPLPNIITPNGDGSNDYFIIDDAYSQLNNAIIIVNRWGNLVFEASPYLNDFNGQDLSEGVYFYIYYPKGKDNPDSKKHGFLHLLR
jgi:gliding motility-associated-like protein